MRTLLILIIFTAFLPIANSLAQKNEKIPVGQISTPYGKILISLDSRTPNHRDSFIELAQAGYWDSLTFNRVIPNFVAQGGCQDTEAGFKDPEYLLEPEFDRELTHVYGAVGAGRDDNPGKLSARCQFYIVQNPEGLHRLDGDYTVFGQVIQGMDVVEKIVLAERDTKDQPLESINLEVKIVYLSQKKYQKLINS